MQGRLPEWPEKLQKKISFPGRRKKALSEMSGNDGVSGMRNDKTAHDAAII